MKGKLLQTLQTLARVALKSRPVPGAKSGSEGREIVVMGNGPSLRGVIDEHRDWLSRHRLMAVNFAANTPEFKELHPALYVLADPHFFTGSKTDANVERLWQNLKGVDWPMTLYVPVPAVHAARQKLTSNVTVKGFNMVAAEGYRWLRHALYNAGLGMPRPRNVMIPSIMCAIREGAQTIHLVGADHTWTQTLSVDNDNHVISIQPHFYKDSADEHKRVATEYKGVRLHDILESLTIAFRSYHDIRRYADTRGVKILNATRGSFIDAFERENIENHKNENICKKNSREH